MGEEKQKVYLSARQSRKLSNHSFWPGDVPTVAGWTINSAFWEFVRRLAASAIPAEVLKEEKLKSEVPQ